MTVIFIIYFILLHYYYYYYYCEDKQSIRSHNLGNFRSQRIILTKTTSSSAVAKRPRDASCLSVVSFNSTKRRVESFIVSYVGYRFVTACS